jgi:hypothetical protein
MQLALPRRQFRLVAQKPPLSSEGVRHRPIKLSCQEEHPRVQRRDTEIEFTRDLRSARSLCTTYVEPANVSSSYSAEHTRRCDLLLSHACAATPKLARDEPDDRFQESALVQHDEQFSNAT